MSESSPGFGRIFLVLLAFLVAGAPLAYLTWDNLSDLVAGHGSFGGTLISLAALALFLILIAALKGWVDRLERRG